MLALTLRGLSDRTPIEAECLTPDRLSSLAVAEILRLPVHHGNRKESLGDFFDARGSASDGEVRIQGDCSTIKSIGASMTRGKIVVEGDVGMHLGAEMSSGEIDVRGSADAWVGAEMQGGLIRVRGDAGGQVGCAYRGGKVGMRGGTILIEKNAGEEVGTSMRRGLIAVGGVCGDFAGASMIAGSIFVFGAPGKRLGAGMRRGSIVLLGAPRGEPGLLPTFRYACDYAPGFLAVYLKQLRSWGFPTPREYAREGLIRRFHGDLVSGGKGEILAWKEA